ncbi:serine/threonine-protein kinase [Streptomyces sp. RKAG293]|uniref:serine/threonine-protein kinase n=1 Tax=Streptomyces sp. RKAG293 TaxID=2893403 RepID=UPI0020342642|nr:serine/threonine-protein kinase [Streptomyces sp. RKAG293]MCM2421103.1 serine/threonine protein kinase [Streptomyces sp. RKAG293]
MDELRPDDPRRVGPYELLKRLGAGGMGEVYLGRSRSGRAVAVKLVRAEIAADPGFRSRFRREVDAARAVSGFWTASVVDADPEADRPWVASQYLEAPDLGVLVQRDGPLPEAALRALGAGLTEALASVHAAGLVHRDLKPGNVLMVADGPRVIDFGISKALDGATMLTGTGAVIGTAGFMSPEQAVGGRVGTESDVFSLGSVLVFAATGRAPFGTGTVPALLYRVVHDEPDLGGVPAALRPVVAACLAKDPRERPGTDALIDTLTAAREDPRAHRPTVVAPAAAPPATPAAPTPAPAVVAFTAAAPTATAPPVAAPAPMAAPVAAPGRYELAQRAPVSGGLGLAGSAGIFTIALVLSSVAEVGLIGNKVTTTSLIVVALFTTVLTWALRALIRARRTADVSVGLDAAGLRLRHGGAEWSRPWAEVQEVALFHAHGAAGRRGCFLLRATVPAGSLRAVPPKEFGVRSGSVGVTSATARRSAGLVLRLDAAGERKLSAALERYARRAYRQGPASTGTG